MISKYSRSTPVVYNYAIGGKTVDGVVNQVVDRFLVNGPGSPDSPIKWDPQKSLFSESIGSLKSEICGAYSAE